MDTESTPITELWYSLDHDELAALIQEATDDDSEDDFDAAKVYSEAKATIDRNYQAMLAAGVAEKELAGMPISKLLDALFVAEKLQDQAGNGPVGRELAEQIKGMTPRGQSVRITELLTRMTHKEIRNIRDGKTCATVNEAAQLAVAYGTTTGELLGIVDADEVRLLKAWRSMDEDKREHLLAFLE